MKKAPGMRNNSVDFRGGLWYLFVYFPCIATFVAIKNETGKWSWAIAVCVYTMLIAWLMAVLTYTICPGL